MKAGNVQSLNHDLCPQLVERRAARKAAMVSMRTGRCSPAMRSRSSASDVARFHAPDAEIRPAMLIGFVCHAGVFNGADSIFRGILVPVFGLKAQLLRRDARMLAESTTKGLTEEQKAAVVASFNEGVAKKTN